MAIKVGINGFGRIGRLVTRAALASGDVEIVGINDITDAKTLAHLMKYDSVHGIYDGVSQDGDAIVVNGKKIPVSAERDPANIPWGSLGAEIVVESTGIFRKKEQATLHMKAGAKKVIISAPSPDCDATIVMGVNDSIYDASKHDVLSNASCTTNCLAPVVKVLHDKFTVKRGPHEYHSLIYKRPAAPRSASQRSAPRPRRRIEHDPDQNRRRPPRLDWLSLN